MMRRFAVLVALLVPLVLVAGPSLSGEKKETPWQPVTLSWYGQSFFILQSSKGTRVAFDPHLIPEYGRTPGLKADIILISHNHNDHTAVQALENYEDKKVHTIRGLKTTGLRADWNHVDETIKDVHIRSVGLYHDDAEGLERGKSTAFVVEVDGWRIVHLGDLGHQLTAEQKRRIGPVDVVMVPVGGVYTLNGSEARKVVADLAPKEYIFPMHCATKVYDDLLPPTEFLEDMDRKKVAHSDDNKITLNRDPERPRPLTVLLNYTSKVRR